MSWELYQKLNSYIEEKGLALMSHEDKKIARTGFPPQSFEIFHHQGSKICLAFTNTFHVIIDRHWIQACKYFAPCFGTGNANDVINGIYQIEQLGNLESFTSFLKDEQFCIAIQVKDDVILNDVLRIDLFRRIEQNENGGYDFTGGLFHAAKHFSYNGIPLSTSSEINDVVNIHQLINLILDAFYFYPKQHRTRQNFEVIRDFDENYNLVCGFYFEAYTGVYFLNTVYKSHK